MLSDRCRRFRMAALAMGGLLPSHLSSLDARAEVRKLPITYTPQQNVQAIKGADAVPVEVRVEDLQPALSAAPWSPRYLFTPPNRYFRVKDAADTIKGAAETELRARGFKIADGGALVTIQLDRFAAVCEINEFTKSSSHGHISLRIHVQAQTGKVLYSREVKGEANPFYFWGTWKCATPELQGSLADGFRRLFADPAFTTAILATRQPTPKTP